MSGFAQKVIYVSPSGNDNYKGTRHAPLQSLTAAIDLSRKKHLKTIILREGKYFDVSVVLNPADSGLIIRNYPHESPILYGGIKLNTFNTEGDLIYTDLPKSKTKWDFRMILVNDSLRNRSILPETGYFNHLNEWNVKLRPAVYGGWERKPTEQELSTMKYKPEDLKAGLDLSSAEISIPHQWSESYVGIQAVDTCLHLIHFSYPAINVPGSLGYKNYVIWNIKEGLTRPGQWFWDKQKNRLYYRLLQNESKNSVEIIIPEYSNVITVNKGSRNIILEGLTIVATGNRLQNESFAAIALDAAISINGADHIRLNKLFFNRIGGNAIRLQGKHIIISNSRIENVGGGGIYFSGEDIRISCNTIQNTGLIFKGAVGIQGNGKKNSISECYINNTPYSGICLGGDSCLVEDCIIRHAMTFMQDGAAVYCGIRNTTIRNNLITGNNTNRFTMGIYFDEQSQNCLAENNIVINTGIPVHCHIARNVLYHNNVFFDENPQHINYGRSSEIVLDHNLFIAPSVLFSGPSLLDKKTDTTTIEPKLRKYANPTGISSFRNNLLIVSSNPEKTQNHCLPPNTDQNLLSGTTVKNDFPKRIKDIKEIIRDKKTSSYIDRKKLKYCLFLFHRSQ